MRITNSISLHNALAQLSTNRTAIDDLQSQISSGLRIQKNSDDPTAAHEVMRASSSLASLDQYKSNIDSLNARNSVEGSSMDQLTNIMARAKELMVGQATGTATPATRATAAAEMEQLFRSAVQIGGTQFNGEYMFGGDTSTTVPFTATGSGATLDFTTTTPSGSRSVAIGVVPAMMKLAEEELMPSLAISLHATTEEQRDRLVPINRKYDIKELIDACRKMPMRRRGKIMFEYVMLAGENDSIADAKRLVKLLRGLKAKVNLLPLNEAAGIPFKRPSDDVVNAFAKVLVAGDVRVTVRKSRGRDIRAACGQLATDEPAPGRSR
jgi:hypothetical protein